MRGKRNLTPEQERDLYADAKLRDSLSIKGLSRKYGIPPGSVKEVLTRQREREREIGQMGRMESGVALV